MQPATMPGRFRTVVKRSRDLGLDHIKKALSNKENPLSKLELDFVGTSCHILGISSEDAVKTIVKRAKEKGGNQPKRVMASLRAQLEELGARVENHKRPTPTPALAMRMGDSMGAPARSLVHLQLCARGLRAAMDGEYARGIKMARKATENVIADFKDSPTELRTSNDPTSYGPTSNDPTSNDPTLKESTSKRTQLRKGLNFERPNFERLNFEKDFTSKLNFEFEL
jgi:hypothetical protein